MVTKQYRQFYLRDNELAKKLWQNKDRPEYEADVWYNRDRNEICQNLLSELCNGKRVLATGVRGWTDEEFLDSIPAREIVKVDIIGDNGIIEADACSLPFSDSYFDVSICRELIEHVIDADALLNEAWRTLTNDGFFLITTPNSYNLFPDGVMHIRGYTPQSLIEALERHGFQVIKKAGNIPNIFSSLLPLSQEGYTFVLHDFKEISKRIENFPDSYYIGTNLFVLAKKVKIGKDNTDL